MLRAGRVVFPLRQFLALSLSIDPRAMLALCRRSTFLLGNRLCLVPWVVMAESTYLLGKRLLLLPELLRRVLSTWFFRQACYVWGPLSRKGKLAAGPTKFLTKGIEFVPLR